MVCDFKICVSSEDCKESVAHNNKMSGLLQVSIGVSLILPGMLNRPQTPKAVAS